MCIRDRLLAVREHLLLGDPRACGRQHEGLHGLVADRIGHADDRGLGDARVACQHVLQLGGGDVLPRPLDHVHLAVDEEEPAVLVHVPLVAGLRCV